MFFGCNNLCFGATFPEGVDRDSNVSLCSNRRSHIRITDKDCPKKLPIPTDKTGLGELIVNINKNLKLSSSHFEFRIINPDEKPIRNDKYVRYILQIYDSRFKTTVFHELYLIISINIDEETVMFIKASNTLIHVNMPDWILIENAFRTAGFIVNLENPVIERPVVCNSMK